MDKLKEVKEIFKKISKTPRGKAFLFFGVYFFFFLFLIIFFRTGTNINYSSNTGNDNNDSYNEITWVDNYKYNYKVVIDDKTYNYSGIRIDEFNFIQYNDKNYYCNNEKCLIEKDKVINEEDEDDDMEEVANPCIYSNILNISNFKKLLSLATKDSTTNYEDGRVAYNYLLSTSTIVKNIDKKDIDLDDIPNSIFIIYKDNIEEKLEIDLTSYGKYSKLCNNSFKIVVEFSNQGNNDLNDIS